LVVIVAIFAILILIEFVFSNSIVMGSFYSLEQNDTIEKVKQADGGFTREMADLDGKLLDRSASADTYMRLRERTSPRSST
jgi:sensor domain CHASE-containing protein